MVTLVLIMAGIALVVAGVVTALVIAVCLVVAQITGGVRAVRRRAAPPPYPGSRSRDASGVPVAPRRAHRLPATYGVAGWSVQAPPDRVQVWSAPASLVTSNTIWRRDGSVAADKVAPLHDEPPAGAFLAG